MNNEERLLELARAKFGELTEAEVTLFRAAASGLMTNFSARNEEDNNPADAADWGDERVLEANRIEWLCTDSQAKALVTHKGIHLEGARVHGELALSFSRIPFPLAFVMCSFTGEIGLMQSHIAALGLPGTHCHSIIADRLKVDSEVFLRNGFQAKHGVRLPGASIGGDLSCTKGKFGGRKEVVIDCDGLKVEKVVAINCDGLKVEGNVTMDDGFKAEGEVRFVGASIKGPLDCSGGIFSYPGDCALCADRLRVKGGIFMAYGFTAEGEVRLLGASIGRDLGCRAGKFSNPKRIALNCEHARVEGTVFMDDGFVAQGEVKLIGAAIGGDVECGNSMFSNPDLTALNGERLKVEGSLSMNKVFKAEGKVNFCGAIVGQRFQWSGVDSPSKVTLDLRSAKVCTLCDEPPSWPISGNLLLHGFSYDEIADGSPFDAATRLKWLRRQPTERFAPQPYEQLALVLRNSGRDEDAEKVLIAKNNYRRRFGDMSFPGKIWFWILRVFVAYGYRPSRALYWGLGFIIAGLILFGEGYSSDAMIRTKQAMSVTREVGDSLIAIEVYPQFSSFVYSVDTFVPLVDLLQADYFLPNDNTDAGARLILYLRVHIAFGWIITTLLLVSMTGLLKK